MATTGVTTEVATKALRAAIDEQRSVIVVPAVRVVVRGASAEVEGYMHVVVVRAESETVNHYEVLVEEWSMGMDADELQRMVGRVATKAREKAEEYVKALKLLTTLNVEISFEGGLASKSWLPAWLRGYLG